MIYLIAIKTFSPVYVRISKEKRCKISTKISQEGKKPITSFILAGHGERSSKDGNAFTINSLSRLEKKPSFSRAQQKRGLSAAGSLS